MTARTKIKTGDMFQRTVKGPNYIALGKATDPESGEQIIIACKNGCINKGGEARVGHAIRRSRAANCKLGKKGTRPALFGFFAKDIARIHGNRPVQLDTVWSRGNAEDIGQEVRLMSRRREGLSTTAQMLK